MSSCHDYFSSFSWTLLALSGALYMMMHYCMSGLPFFISISAHPNLTVPQHFQCMSEHQFQHQKLSQSLFSRLNFLWKPRTGSVCPQLILSIITTIIIVIAIILITTITMFIIWWTPAAEAAVSVQPRSPIKKVAFSLSPSSLLNLLVKSSNKSFIQHFTALHLLQTAMLYMCCSAAQCIVVL